MRHFTNNAEKRSGIPGRHGASPSTIGLSLGNDPNDKDIHEEEKNGDGNNDEDDEDEDDYMTMTFADVTPTIPETSLQRRQRLQKEGLRRGLVPSKAQLAEQERERREEGLSRSLLSDPAVTRKSKGLAMMAKMGFKPGAALGRPQEESDGDGNGNGGSRGVKARTEPLRIEVREDRGGIGLVDEKKRKLREAAAELGFGVDDDEEEEEEGGEEGERRKRKKKKVEEEDYRVRIARERDSARKEKLVFAAQKIVEGMDEDRAAATAAISAATGDGEEEEGRDENNNDDKKKKNKTAQAGSSSFSSRPLKSIPVLYRGLVRRREEAERDRRARYDLEQSSGGLSAKLPTYEEDEEEMDADDRFALGRGKKLVGGDDNDDDDDGTNKKKRVDNKKTVVYMPADDLDEEDEELEAFNALEVDERLKRLVEYLRTQYWYCFWCKFTYPDEAMEGCPGITEEDHD